MGRHPQSNSLRLIGGQWRGRVLRFPSVPGLRPTPDRVRETVFNWLGQRLDGMSCLDLFAGSGALGLEAASRGATRVVMIERDMLAATALEAHVRALDATMVRVIRADALNWIRGAEDSFDLIFLDPPFASDLLPLALAQAATVLAPEGTIYAEFNKRPAFDGWHVVREGRAGQTCQVLLRR